MNIHHVLKSSLFSNNFVVQIQAMVYPVLFVQHIIGVVQKKSGVQKQVLDVSRLEANHIISQLEMSFLGQQKLYWLGNISALSAAASKKWFTYLSHYNGPHYVLFYAEKKSEKISSIELPEKISTDTYRDILCFWPVDEAERLEYFAVQVLKKVGLLTLDQFVTLIEYGFVLGSAREAFLNDWLEVIVKPESSLFTLSGALFAGKSDVFYREWHRLQGLYEFPFWLAYFSEQFFRAYYYVIYRQERRLVDAKKIGFKLPFSFLQRDWQRFQPDVFAHVHKLLYTLDGNLKNGGSSKQLERMFITFLK